MDPETEVDNFVAEINEAIETLSFEIKKGRSAEGDVFWTMVNTKKDKLMEAVTPFSQLQTKLVKFLVC